MSRELWIHDLWYVFRTETGADGSVSIIVLNVVRTGYRRSTFLLHTAHIHASAQCVCTDSLVVVP